MKCQDQLYSEGNCKILSPIFLANSFFNQQLKDLISSFRTDIAWVIVAFCYFILSGFLRSLVSTNFWNIFNHCSRFLGNPWEILEQTSMFLLVSFVQSLFSTKKSPKVVNFPLTDGKLCLSFWCHKQAKWLLQFSKLLLSI